MAVIMRDFEARTRAAVAHYWNTLDTQAARQQEADADRGNRAAVTGGKQMDGFAILVSELLRKNGLKDASVFRETKLQLPGYFRPTKKWDMLVVHEGQLLAALEFKSQRGPSFGNNFNNRSEDESDLGNRGRFGHAIRGFAEGLAS